MSFAAVSPQVVTYYFVVGHRGVGKSQWLLALKTKHPDWHFWDLDEELRRHHPDFPWENLSAREPEFRRLEQETLARIVKQARIGIHVVAVGAGYQGDFPPGGRVIWLQRETDPTGRIFVNRPRLDPQVTPLAEYRHRFEDRENRYRTWSDWIHVRREGFQDNPDWEDLLPKDQTQFGFNAFLTVPKRPRDRLRFWLHHALRTGARRLEIRDDVLSRDEIELVLREVPPHQLLFSARNSPEASQELLRKLAVSPRVQVDLPLEWAVPAVLSHYDLIRSIHGRPGADFRSLQQKAELAVARREIVKLAITVDTLDELKLWHQWWWPLRARVAFLPMMGRWNVSPSAVLSASPSSMAHGSNLSLFSSWRWYRLWALPHNPLNFFRLDSRALSTPEDPSIEDQPLWHELVERDHAPAPHWGAVLGEPVTHSWTPSFHSDFGYHRGAYFTRVPCRDLDTEGLEFLRSLGLRWVAVTSPLKEKVSKLVPTTLSSVNTLYLGEEGAIAAMTDEAALELVLAKWQRNPRILVWGGGGLLASLRRVLPKATYASARSGKNRDTGEVLTGSWDAVVWSAPNGDGLDLPPAEWQVGEVVDLNYFENSRGRELALQWKCRYTSGEALFLRQALEQQRFWRNCEGG